MQIKQLQEQDRKMQKVKYIQYEPEVVACSLSKHIRLSNSNGKRGNTSNKKSRMLMSEDQ
jgi:hypothetical protein